MKFDRQTQEKRRSIRENVVITMAVSFLVMFALLYIVFSISMNSLLAERESETIRNQTDLECNMLSTMVEYIPTVTREWAELSYVYNYVTGEDDLIYRTHLAPDNSYSLNRVNLLAILDNDGNLMFEKFYRYVEGEAVDHPVDLLPLYSEYAQMCKDGYKASLISDGVTDGSLSVCGFSAHEGGVYYLSAYPIVDTRGGRPMAGTLIFGRIIDDEEIVLMRQGEDFFVAVDDRSSIELTASEAQELDAEGFLLRTGDDLITGHSAMKDVNGENKIIVSVAGSRTLQAQSNAFTRMVILIVAAGCALILLLTLNLLERIVVRPLSKLAHDTREIDLTVSDSAVTCESSSREIQEVSQSINQMLEQIRDDRNVIEKKNESLYYNANFDALTGLRNRASANRLMEEMLSRAKKDGSHLTVYYVDIDRLKFVNDTMGHAMGNHLIGLIAQRMQENLASASMLARMSGDEFIVCVQNLKTESEWRTYGDKILDIFRQPFRLKERVIDIGVTIGSSTCPDDGQDADTLVKYAEMAMYHAKELGRGQYVPYKKDLSDMFQRKVYVEDNLRVAINAGCKDFQLHYQPKLSIRTGKMESCEALIRWNVPSGRIFPDEFIPSAEETGLIVPITWWILEECSRFSKKMKDLGLPAHVAVNIPAQVMMHEHFIRNLKNATEKIGADTGDFDIEIIERTMLDDVLRVGEVFKELQDLRAEVSVDDFGTGYSSLSYLNQLSINRLKIDRSFVMDIEENEDSRSIVKAIIAMAKSLGLSITAEGVETQEQYKFLKDNDCDEIQGYLISRPMPEDDYIKFVQSWNESDFSALS